MTAGSSAVVRDPRSGLVRTGRARGPVLGRDLLAEDELDQGQLAWRVIPSVRLLGCQHRLSERHSHRAQARQDRVVDRVLAE